MPTLRPDPTWTPPVRQWPVPAEPWSGPAWAAPERVERWMCRPRRHGPEDPLWAIVCTMMAQGIITPASFQEAVRVKIQSFQEK